MAKYNRVNLLEREEISRYLVMNYTYREIASILKRAPSTIYREIYRRGFTRDDYRAISAQTQRTARIHRKPRKLEQNQELLLIVITYLRLRWSPEQIANRLKILYPNDMNMHVSHETIYAYLYVYPRGGLKRRLTQYLRRQHKIRRVKDKERKKSHFLQEDFVSIDERPLEVANRTIAGHWEGDLIMGPMNRSAIGTLVERKTRMTFIVKLNSKDAPAVRKAFSDKLNRLPIALKKSLTYDQGQEMAEYKLFTQNTQIQVYFAHPHSPWERGTSENTNALIRDFLPRGTDFSKIASAKLQKIENMLNDRPRKVLNFYTPREIFTKTIALAT